MLSKIIAWMRQPTTVGGLAGMAYGLVQLLQHKVTLETGLPLLVGSLVALIIPDNTAAQSAAVQIATDAMSAASSTLLNTAAYMAKKSAVVLLLAGMGMLVSGCANNSPTTTTASSWANTVAAIQLTWPIAQAGINADLETVSPAVTKAEAVVSADVAALSGTSAPTSLATALADVKGLVAAIPTTSISATHQQQIQALLAVVQAGVGVFG